MNILMISDVYFPRVNGVSTSIQTFRRQLERLGHQVTLIAPDYGRAAADEGGILRIPARRVVLDPEDRMMRARAVFRRLDTLARQRFDIQDVISKMLDQPSVRAASGRYFICSVAVSSVSNSIRSANWR